MATIHIDEGEDWLKQYQNWQKQKWWKRVSIKTWLGCGGFLGASCTIISFLVYYYAL